MSDGMSDFQRGRPIVYGGKLIAQLEQQLREAVNEIRDLCIFRRKAKNTIRELQAVLGEVQDELYNDPYYQNIVCRIQKVAESDMEIPNEKD